MALLVALGVLAVQPVPDDTAVAVIAREMHHAHRQIIKPLHRVVIGLKDRADAPITLAMIIPAILFDQAVKVSGEIFDPTAVCGMTCKRILKLLKHRHIGCTRDHEGPIMVALECVEPPITWRRPFLPQEIRLFAEGQPGGRRGKTPVVIPILKRRFAPGIGGKLHRFGQLLCQRIRRPTRRQGHEVSAHLIKSVGGGRLTDRLDALSKEALGLLDQLIGDQINWAVLTGKAAMIMGQSARGRRGHTRPAR